MIYRILILQAFLAGNMLELLDDILAVTFLCTLLVTLSPDKDEERNDSYEYEL